LAHLRGANAGFDAQNRVRRKTDFARCFRPMTLVMPLRENYSVSFYQKLWFIAAILPHREGRTRRHDT
jgi:hypothetical protein